MNQPTCSRSVSESQMDLTTKYRQYAAELAFAVAAAQTPQAAAIAEEGMRLVLTLVRKNRSYGNSVFNPPVLAQHIDEREAIQVRMSDKIARINSLLTRRPGEEPPHPVHWFENVIDTFLDLAGYSILWAVKARIDAGSTNVPETIADISGRTLAQAAASEDPSTFGCRPPHPEMQSATSVHAPGLRAMFTDEELEALDDLATRMDLPVPQILRQALRTYQTIALGHGRLVDISPLTKRDSWVHLSRLAAWIEDMQRLGNPHRQRARTANDIRPIGDPKKFFNIGWESAFEYLIECCLNPPEPVDPEG